MSATTQKITPELAEICRSRVPKLRVEILDEVDSTNSFAANIPPSEDPVAIFANRQTAGRGRIGRKWASPMGNIYVSFVFFPKISATEIANWTLWQGAQICEMLNEKYAVPAKVKWPNDIFLGGEKLAGMLTDVSADSLATRKIVLGVGLNVFSKTEDFPPEVRGVATSLALHKQDLPELNVVAADLTECVIRAAEVFFKGTFRERLAELWERYDFLRGKEVSATYGLSPSSAVIWTQVAPLSSGPKWLRHLGRFPAILAGKGTRLRERGEATQSPFSGIAEGVDKDGSLRIRLNDGTIRSFSAGDAILGK